MSRVCTCDCACGLSIQLFSAPHPACCPPSTCVLAGGSPGTFNYTQRFQEGDDVINTLVGFNKEDGTTGCVREVVCHMIAASKPALLNRLGMLEGALRTRVCVYVCVCVCVCVCACACARARVCAPHSTQPRHAVQQVRNATNSQRAAPNGRWVIARSIGCWGEARPMHGVVACASWSCRHSRRFCLLIPPRPCVTARHPPHLPHTPRAPRKYSTFSHGQTAEIPQNTLIPGFNRKTGRKIVGMP